VFIIKLATREECILYLKYQAKNYKIIVKSYRYSAYRFILYVIHQWNMFHLDEPWINVGEILTTGEVRDLKDKFFLRKSENHENE